MGNLYEMSRELALINDTIIDAEGEISLELETRLNSLPQEFEAKALSIGKWTLDLAGNEAAIDAEIKRLQAKKRVTVNLEARLTEYVKTAMMQSDRLTIKSPTLTLAIQKNPPSAEIVSEEMLPAQFTRIVQTITVDKKMVLDALKEGYEVPGAKLIDNKTHLRVK